MFSICLNFPPMTTVCVLLGLTYLLPAYVKHILCEQIFQPPWEL